MEEVEGEPDWKYTTIMKAIDGIDVNRRSCSWNGRSIRFKMWVGGLEGSWGILSSDGDWNAFPEGLVETDSLSGFKYLKKHLNLQGTKVYGPSAGKLVEVCT